MLELPLGDVPELDQRLAERNAGPPLAGERGLELSRRDEVRLDQDVTQQMLAPVLAEHEVELVRGDELLVDEQLPEQGRGSACSWRASTRSSWTSLIKRSLTRRPPSRGCRRGRAASGGRCGSRSGVQLRHIHRVPPRRGPVEDRWIRPPENHWDLESYETDRAKPKVLVAIAPAWCRDQLHFREPVSSGWPRERPSGRPFVKSLLDRIRRVRTALRCSRRRRESPTPVGGHGRGRDPDCPCNAGRCSASDSDADHRPVRGHVELPLSSSAPAFRRPKTVRLTPSRSGLGGPGEVYAAHPRAWRKRARRRAFRAFGRRRGTFSLTAFARHRTLTPCISSRS